VDAAGLKIRKGDSITVAMGYLCRDPNQWIKPNEFIPERFDSKSEFYLTPKGVKRNPFAFSPFLGGMRICLGKTFVESVSKVMLPVLLTKFDFELPDAANFVLPHNNMLCLEQPVVLMRVKKISN
jgi:cytochrome P450